MLLASFFIYNVITLTYAYELKTYKNSQYFKINSEFKTPLIPICLKNYYSHNYTPNTSNKSP